MTRVTTDPATQQIDPRTTHERHAPLYLSLEDFDHTFDATLA